MLRARDSSEGAPGWVGVPALDQAGDG